MMYSSILPLPKEVKQIIESGDITLVIYSPDAVLSNLIPSIESEIQSRTGCNPIFRLWFKHNEQSIEQFYINSIENNLPHWHLILSLFTYGPSLLTFWKGENAQEKILSIKGSSHPAYAKAGTIRSRFWCDNSVCNLIHVSDNTEEIFRELSIISSITCHFNLKKIISLPLFYSPYSSTPKHNSLFNLCSVLSRNISENSDHFVRLEIPFDDCAINSAKYLISWLEKSLKFLNADLSNLVKKIIERKIPFNDITSQIVGQIPMTQWETFLVLCCVNSFDVWYDEI
jgi:nucleoside diphosphate kinase